MIVISLILYLLVWSLIVGSGIIVATKQNFHDKFFKGYLSKPAIYGLCLFSTLLGGSLLAIILTSFAPTQLAIAGATPNLPGTSLSGSNLQNNSAKNTKTPQTTSVASAANAGTNSHSESSTNTETNSTSSNTTSSTSTNTNSESSNNEGGDSSTPTTTIVNSTDTASPTATPTSTKTPTASATVTPTPTLTVSLQNALESLLPGQSNNIVVKTLPGANCSLSSNNANNVTGTGDVVVGSSGTATWSVQAQKNALPGIDTLTATCSEYNQTKSTSSAFTIL